MRYLALATDYDGTLAYAGVTRESTIEALNVLRKSDRFLVMVTGRLLEDLQRVLPQVDLFDAIVAENGAVLYDPAKNEQIVLTAAPPPELRRLLEARGVPLESGHVILGTREPHEKEVLDAIRELGLEMQLIFNKGAVMVLPSGINKASGLSAALSRLKLSPHNALGVGDAENDHAFLNLCECSAATANALESVKAQADIVLDCADGDGVAELARRVLDCDLADVVLNHRNVPLGKAPDGREVVFNPYLQGILLFAGTSGGGKSTGALGFVERLMQRGYQICIIDPEGDYESFGGAIVLGDATTIPTLDEVADVLDEPGRSAIVSLLGVPMHDRPAFVDALLPQLFSCRARYGRPHWIVIDEAHHVFPREQNPDTVLPRDLYGMLAIATKPYHLATSLLESVRAVVAVGDDARRTIEEATGAELPEENSRPGESQALYWHYDAPHVATVVDTFAPQSKKQRHRRKYAQGTLAPEKSFFFRGPDQKLNLRAHNLTIFVQIAEGLDEETWIYHLRRGDYARWFAQAIGDDELVDAANRAQSEPDESRQRVLAAIRERYTNPA